MEKEKYYTPTIEEFHVGFEAEWSEFGRKIWSEVIIDEHDLIELFTGEEKIEHYRVKYIDREDIESFGFIYEEISSKYGNEDEYRIKFLGYKEIWIKIQRRDYTKIKIVSTDEGFNIDGPNYSTKFSGIIKNKSEFSRLLKQLSII